MKAPMLVMHPKLFHKVVTMPEISLDKIDWAPAGLMAIKIVPDPYCSLTTDVYVRRSRFRASKFYKPRKYKMEQQYVAYWMDTVTFERTAIRI